MDAPSFQYLLLLSSSSSTTMPSFVSIAGADVPPLGNREEEIYHCPRRRNRSIFLLTLHSAGTLGSLLAAILLSLLTTNNFWWVLGIGCGVFFANIFHQLYCTIAIKRTDTHFEFLPLGGRRFQGPPVPLTNYAYITIRDNVVSLTKTATYMEELDRSGCHPGCHVAGTCAYQIQEVEQFRRSHGLDVPDTDS
jgi:hypothetical protein